MTSRSEVVVHRAGELVNGVQLCVDCGLVLNDYRNAAWPEGDPPPRGWEEGASIRKHGSGSSVVYGGNDRRCKEPLQ